MKRTTSEANSKAASETTEINTVEAPPGALSHIAEGLRPLAVALSKVTPDPANARKHGRRNTDGIKASLVRFGQRVPLVVNRATGIIEKGNGTYEAARELEWAHIAVVYVEDDPMTAAGFSIADNRLAELAEWDFEALGTQMQVLLDADFDLQPLGWVAHELEPILAADWSPPAIDDNLAGGAEQGKEEKAAPIAVSKEQREVIDRAIEALRDRENDTSLTEGRCLELICGVWLDRHS